MTTSNLLDKTRALKTRLQSAESNRPRRGHSATLVAIDPFIAAEPVLILTKRTETVESHKGQVSFPGGFYEGADKDLMETALREFEEEMGGHRSFLEIIGCLPTSYTHTRVPIFPWLGIVRTEITYRPNPSEVDKLLLLSVKRLIDEGLKPVEIKLPQVTLTSPGIHVEGELVWGATARILLDLRNLFL